MKYPVAFLIAAASLAGAEPLTTKAAKMKPSAEWTEHPTRLVSSLPDYQSTTDGELSTYGGIKGVQHEATGFFHPKKVGKRWWLVDPEGHPFIHVGVVAVSPPGGKGTPAAINYGNIPPSIDGKAGGITMSHALHTVVLSLAGLRRLRGQLGMAHPLSRPGLGLG